MKKDKQPKTLIESGSPEEATEPAKESIESPKEALPKEDPNEIESMAEMSTSDDHHWSHLEAITDHVSEKTLKESSWNFENAAQEVEQPADDSHLAPSISGAIEQFMSKNKDKELSDKQVMYKLHKAVSDQVPDEVMFPTANEIKDAVPESVIPDSVVEKHIPEEQEESQQLD